VIVDYKKGFGSTEAFFVFVDVESDDVACSGCGTPPAAGWLWQCAPDGCGGAFDTFASRGRCPHCSAQFAWTHCLLCRRVFAHQAFYVRTR
jgi:hypothetical protein